MKKIVDKIIKKIISKFPEKYDELYGCDGIVLRDYDYQKYINGTNTIHNLCFIFNNNSTNKKINIEPSICSWQANYSEYKFAMINPKLGKTKFVTAIKKVNTLTLSFDKIDEEYIIDFLEKESVNFLKNLGC